jgi:tetratricopeptide (TPR) repeat protein
MFLSPGRVLFSIRYYLLIAFTAGLVLTPVLVVRAQGGVDLTGTGGKHKIQGRIYFPSGRRSDATSVRVNLESTSSEKLSLIADLNGTFTFNAIAPGSYNVTVDAGKDYEIAREFVNVEGSGIRSRSLSGAEMARADVPRIFNVIVNLQLKRSAAGKSRPAVLDAALSTVPPPAVELYDKAIDAIRAGDTKKAIELLQAAVSYYPEFTIALNELGIQYLALEQPDKAADVLQRALKIRPDDFNLLLHYGMALLKKNDALGAEAQLRQAVKKNDEAWQAHMYLGITLISLRNYVEAEKELLRTLLIGGDELSLPHYYLGGIYWGRRDYRRAADELEKYLKLAPKAPNAERTRASIKELRTKQS